MKQLQVIMVRVYIMEAEKLLKPILHYLHEKHKVRGVTVFRGITGFGQSGVMHTASLLDLSMDLPLAVEFFDTPDRITPILDHLATLLEPGHIICWQAMVGE